MKKNKNGLYITKIRTKLYYLNDKLHREDGPAVEYIDGCKQWYINDKLHREDGPAVEYANGNKSWYLNGNLHREDGPAIEYINGNKSYYIHNSKIDAKSQEEFEKIVKLLIFK